jgi:uncharacterized DUF497 family protein
MRFEWDDAKDRSNQRKHGLSFTEAKQLFEGNQDYLEIFDVSHSDNEDRFIAIGDFGRGIAVVVDTEREADLIRIIGARFATRRERERYRAYMDQQV